MQTSERNSAKNTHSILHDADCLFDVIFYPMQMHSGLIWLWKIAVTKSHFVHAQKEKTATTLRWKLHTKMWGCTQKHSKWMLERVRMHKTITMWPLNVLRVNIMWFVAKYSYDIPFIIGVVHKELVDSFKNLTIIILDFKNQWLLNSSCFGRKRKFWFFVSFHLNFSYFSCIGTMKIVNERRKNPDI